MNEILTQFSDERVVAFLEVLFASLVFNFEKEEKDVVSAWREQMGQLPHA